MELIVKILKLASLPPEGIPRLTLRLVSRQINQCIEDSVFYWTPIKILLDKVDWAERLREQLRLQSNHGVLPEHALQVHLHIPRGGAPQDLTPINELLSRADGLSIRVAPLENIHAASPSLSRLSSIIGTLTADSPRLRSLELALEGVPIDPAFLEGGITNIAFIRLTSVRTAQLVSFLNRCPPLRRIHACVIPQGSATPLAEFLATLSQHKQVLEQLVVQNCSLNRHPTMETFSFERLSWLILVDGNASLINNITAPQLTRLVIRTAGAQVEGVNISNFLIACAETLEELTLSIEDSARDEPDLAARTSGFPRLTRVSLSLHRPQALMNILNTIHATQLKFLELKVIIPRADVWQSLIDMISRHSAHLQHLGVKCIRWTLLHEQDIAMGPIFRLPLLERFITWGADLLLFLFAYAPSLRHIQVGPEEHDEEEYRNDGKKWPLQVS